MSYLLQLLLSIFLAAPLILGTLPQLLQPLGFLLGKVDLITQLLLQMDLFHLHCAVLLLGLVQPGGDAGSWRRPGKGASQYATRCGIKEENEGSGTENIFSLFC